MIDEKTIWLAAWVVAYFVNRDTHTAQVVAKKAVNQFREAFEEE